MSDSAPDYKVGPGKPPLHSRFRKGRSGNPHGHKARNLPALLVDALNEAVYLTVQGKRRRMTKREAVIAQLVDKSASADLRATKMLIDMMKDIERKAGVAAPPEPHRFAPADEQVIKGVVERIRGALLQEIQDMNAGNPALAMILLPPEYPDQGVSKATLPADGAV